MNTPRRKAVILSPFFYPEPISTGKYNTYLAQALVSQGCDVEVMSCHPLYPKWEVEPTDKQLEDVFAIRGGRWLKFPSNMLFRRLILEVWYLFFVFVHYLTRRKIYDIVIPVFPPSMFAIPMFLLKPKKSKMVGVVHDLQGVYSTYTGSQIRKWIYQGIAWVEKRAFHACDHIIFLSESMRTAASNAYALNKEKSSVHYPFVTIEQFTNTGELSEIISDGELAIVYSGALGEKQSPDKLINLYLALLEMKEDLKAHVFSQGPIFDRLKEEYNHPRLNFHPLVAEEMLPELLLRSTIQVIPQESGTSDGSLPSKLPNLLAAGVKVLCITDLGSEIASILARYSRGKVATSWDMEPLVDLVLSMLEDDLDRKSDGDVLLLKDFTRQGLVDKIIDIK